MGGGSSSTKSRSTLDPSQQAMLKAMSEYLVPRISQGPTPYKGKIVQGTDEFMRTAYKDFQSLLGAGANEAAGIVRSTLQGGPTYTANVPKIASEFSKYVVDPVSKAIQSALGFDTASTLNTPGGFYSSRVGDKYTQTMTNAITAQTAPLLSSAIEAERGRGFTSGETFTQNKLIGAEWLQQLPITTFNAAFGAGQSMTDRNNMVLNAKYQEFLRSQQSNPWITMAGGIATSPTMENIVQQKSSPWSSILSAGTALGSAALMGGMNPFAPITSFFNRGQ